MLLLWGIYHDWLCFFSVIHSLHILFRRMTKGRRWRLPVLNWRVGNLLLGRDRRNQKEVRGFGRKKRKKTGKMNSVQK